MTIRSMEANNWGIKEEKDPLPLITSAAFFPYLYYNDNNQEPAYSIISRGPKVSIKFPIKIC